MAEISVSVALVALTKTSNMLGDLIVKEGYCLFRLQEEISWVEREMRHIQSYLNDVEYKHPDSERMANLMRDIRSLAFDVEDTVENYSYLFSSSKGEGFRGFFKRISRILFNVYGAHNFLVDIESIKRRVDDLPRVRQTYNINEQHSEQASSVEREGWEARRSFPHVDELNIFGFEDHIKNLVAKIRNADSAVRVISITGMPGLGKTTLAKKVYNSVRNSFDLKAWVYVSEQPNIQNILKDIARQVGFKPETWDGLKPGMYEHLSENRYIIVIDDIWHTGPWDALKAAIPTNSQNGSRIILTSRHMEVGRHVGGTSSLFELQCLGMRDSNQLFEASIGLSQNENDPPGLKGIGKKILHKCGGVPLAIVVVTGLLKKKMRSESAWNGVLEQMDEKEGELSKTFVLSYTDLPTNLKPCFLYFGLFPEDHEIDTFDLVNLWAAEGFVKGSGVRDVEEVGDDYLNQLIDRNLIQGVRKDSNGKVKICRIHDILQSLCIQVAKDVSFSISSIDLTNYHGETVRRVTTYRKTLRDHISSNHRTPKLRSFICFSDEDWDSIDMTLLMNFWKELSLLRVLSLQVSIDYTRFSKEIWSLKNLTYLKLEISTTEKTPHIPESIIDLTSLLTLDVQFRGKSVMIQIPLVIWNMKRLRHLLLPIGERVATTSCKGFNPNAIGFRNFQTLVVPCKLFQADWLHKFSNLRILKINILSDNKEIGKLLLTSNTVVNTLETLEVIVIPICGRLHVTKLNMFGYQNHSNLSLSGVDIGEWPRQHELPPNLTQIVLDDCELIEDPLKVMKKIPKLRVLKLIACRLPKMVCTGKSGNFPQLEHLTMIPPPEYLHGTFFGEIHGMVYNLEVKDGGMPRLKEFVTAPNDYFLTMKLPTRLYGILLTPDFEGTNSLA